jgi:hypothetical protein
METLGIYLVVGLVFGGLAVGSGIFRGLRKLGLSMVRSAKIMSNAQVSEHRDTHIWYASTDTENGAE